MSHICLCMSEMNGSKDIKDRREESELFCHKVLTLLVKKYSVICKLTSSQCILQMPWQPLKKSENEV